MKDNLLDALKRLLVHAIDPSDASETLQQQFESIDKIEQHETEVVKPASDKSFRILDPIESIRFSPEALNLLQTLEQIQMLDPQRREQLIYTLLDLEHQVISADDIKWEILRFVDPNLPKDQQIFLEFLLSSNQESQH